MGKVKAEFEGPFGVNRTSLGHFYFSVARFQDTYYERASVEWKYL
jgi:hypothetical protein